MSSTARTNQLLYQVELLLGQAPGSDEHAPARRMALEEAALGQLEMALDALLREVTQHTEVTHSGWREWLVASDVSVAELERLRTLAASPESWLATLLVRVDALHSDAGAARRRSHGNLITAGGVATLHEELGWCHREFKALLPALREGSQEW